MIKNAAPSLQISIPKPCHEDWDQMTPVNQGNFCGSCRKVVYDFTSMSDEEIIQFFQNKKEESICGRMKTKEPVTLPKFSAPAKNFWQRVSRISFFAYALYMIFGSKLFAATKTIHGGMFMPNMTNIHPIQTIAPPDTIEPIMTGKIVAGLKKPDPSIDLGQMTVIKQPVVEIDTNMNHRPVLMGDMTLSLPPSDSLPTISIDTAVSIIIEPDETHQSTNITNPSIQDHDWKLFPDPTDKNLTIEWDAQKITGIEIYDMGGKLMKSVSAGDISGTQMTLDVGYFPAGTYVLYLRDDIYVRQKKFLMIK